MYDCVNFYRDYGVLFVCAPMEADWQLVALEKQGLTQASVSEDSDLLAIESMHLLHKVNFTSGKCHVINLQSVLEFLSEKLSSGRSWTRLDFIEYSLFLGCDYLDNVPNHGPVAVNKLMDIWISSTEEFKSNVLNLIGETNSFRTILVDGAGGTTARNSKTKRHRESEYQPTFEKARLLMYNPPVYKLETSNTNNGKNPIISTATLTSLLNLVTSSARQRRDQPSVFTPAQLRHNQYSDLDFATFKLEVWIRTKKHLESIVGRQPINDKGEKLPWGCELNFNNWPIHNQHLSALIKYVASRGINIITGTKRNEIIKYAQHLAKH